MHIQQISDEGTANPIVARLTIQTQDLLQYFIDLSEQQRQQIFSVMFSDIQPKLLVCSKIANELDGQIKEHQKVVDEKGVQMVGGGAFRLPSISDLQPRAETFLYHAKSVLRDLTKLFAILFDQTFDSARFDLVARWAKKKFGPTDELARMLGTDLEWTKRIVDMRNAVEHPGGHAGHLHVENFTAEKSRILSPAGRRGRENPVVMVTEPQWYLNTEEQGPIASDMLVLVDNLLTLCEQTLILCLNKFKKDFPILIGEVPEAERDPRCPVRYKMMLDTSRVKWPPAG
jgi:hypothetical protein